LIVLDEGKEELAKIQELNPQEQKEEFSEMEQIIIENAVKLLTAKLGKNPTPEQIAELYLTYISHFRAK